MGTILMKDPPRHCCLNGCFSQENLCKGGLGVMSGGKDILNVWEKSCVSGSLESVCMEMGSFRIEFSGEKKIYFVFFVCLSPLFFLFSALCSLIAIIFLHGHVYLPLSRLMFAYFPSNYA